MRSHKYVLVLLSLLINLRAETIFPSHSGAWWFGSDTVYVGAYEWDPEHEPLGVTSSGGGFTVAADHPNITCNAATDVCTTGNPMYPWGGLPTNTQVKFVSNLTLTITSVSNTSPVMITTSTSHSLQSGQAVTIQNVSSLLNKSWTITAISSTTFTLNGSTSNGSFTGGIVLADGSLPGGLVSWKQDHWKAYYIRDWGFGGNPKAFKLAATPDGTAIDITSAGTGIHGMSFAGYRQTFSMQAAAAKRYTYDTATNAFTALDGTPHGMAAKTTVYVEPTVGGLLPIPLVNFQSSRFKTYCVVPISSTSFQLFEALLSVSCTDTSSPVAGVNPYGNGTLPVGNANQPVLSLQGGSGSVYIYQHTFPTIVISSITGYPPGTTLSWRLNSEPRYAIGTNTTNGYGSIGASVGAGTWFAKVPAITPPGDYIVRVNTSESSTASINPNFNEFTLHAIPLVPVSKQGPSAYPSIPGFKTAAAGMQPWRNWETMLFDPSGGTHGGGTGWGGSGTTGGPWPRCPNRQDAEAPFGYNLPTSPSYSTGTVTYISGTAVSASGPTTATITHNRGTTAVNIQAWYGNGPGYIPLPFTVVAQTATTVTVNFTSPSPYVTFHINPNFSMGSAQLPTPYVLVYSNSGTASGYVWFYNDQTFFKTAEYTGDPTWTNCGMKVAKAMRDVFAGPGGPTAMYGFYYFPWSMVSAYGYTGDSSYRTQVIRTAELGNNNRGGTQDLGMREHSFAFERWLARYAVTGEWDYHLQYFADAAIAMIYANAVGAPERTFWEPFMSGLISRPLIRYYKITHDERIPVVLKLILDKTWTNWYDQTAHHFYYNPEPEGERCW